MDEHDNEIVILISNWDRETGSKVIDFYPETNLNTHLEKISEKIFAAYNNFWKGSGDKLPQARFILPLGYVNRIASIYFDLYSFP